jgi:hypothetical protein
MTAVTAPAPAPPAPPAGPRKPRRERRWIRLALPLGLVLLFWAVTYTLHAMDEPDLGEAGTFSPVGTGAHGSSRLADLLREQGVTVERVTTPAEAVRAATGRDATVFIPTPDFVGSRILAVLGQAPGSHRVVVVRPGTLFRISAALPVGVRTSRWATATVAPDCSTDFAERAGPAAMRRDVYEADQPAIRCYGGGLVGFRFESNETLYVGASEPFRNDRIDEAGNARLAVGLLAAHPRVIWVDVHAPAPLEIDRPQIDLPNYERPDQNRTNTGFPIIDAFPSFLWAFLVLAAGGAVLLAIVRARRLGPPVPEPLPVLVPAAEAVTGRGRLYERVSAREASLDALRSAAISRLARVLDPMAGAAPDRGLHPNSIPTSSMDVVDGRGPAVRRFVARVAERAGWPDNAVRDVLYGRPPDGDEELTAAARQLDVLVEAVVREGPARTDPRGGTP